MKILVTLLFIISFSFTYAQADLSVQTDEIAQINDLENLLRAVDYMNIESPSLNEIEGSAYLEDDFVNGSITLSSGITYTDIPLRYNVYNDQIEFQSNNEKIYNINNPDAIQKISFGSMKFIYIDCYNNNQSSKIFAEVIAEGNVNLLKQYRIKLLPAKPAETHKDAMPPRFAKFPSKYYLQNNTGIIQYFKKEKDLIALLSDNAKDVKKFISSNKLSTKNESDLIQIIDFYNSLKN